MYGVGHFNLYTEIYQKQKGKVICVLRKQDIVLYFIDFKV